MALSLRKPVLTGGGIEKVGLTFVQDHIGLIPRLSDVLPRRLYDAAPP